MTTANMGTINYGIVKEPEVLSRDFTTLPLGGSLQVEEYGYATGTLRLELNEQSGGRRVGVKITQPFSGPFRTLFGNPLAYGHAQFLFAQAGSEITLKEAKMSTFIKDTVKYTRDEKTGKVVAELLSREFNDAELKFKITPVALDGENLNYERTNGLVFTPCQRKESNKYPWRPNNLTVRYEKDDDGLLIVSNDFQVDPVVTRTERCWDCVQALFNWDTQSKEKDE